MSLTELSFYFRRSLPFIILGFLFVLVLVYLVRFLFLVIDTTPKKTVFVNPVFGKIPTPIIDSATTSAGLSFVLDTVEGEPVTATPTAQVFFLPEATTKFGYREKIYAIAKNLGFDTETVKHTLVGKEATFDDGKRHLVVDVTNFNYTYEYNYATDEAFFQNAIVPDEDAIRQRASDFLKSVGRYPEELAQGKSNILYFNLDVPNNRLYATERPQEANVVEVDFYRPDIAADPAPIPVVPPTYFNSQNHVVMVFNQNATTVLRSKVAFFEKSSAEVGVYPVKNGDMAWEELKAGEGKIISNETQDGQILVKRMFLSYYDPSTYQPYLQPVYVFLGDNNFVAYLPAVASEHLAE